MIKLSAAIITFNEENNIARCVESLQQIADEIIIVDSLSTDRTKEICLALGCKVIERPFSGHIEQKNFAIDQTSHDYIISLDADEALDESLQTQILDIKKNWKSDAYRFNRLTNYNGKWIYHCGWYPDTKTRLFKKNKARWGGKNPHDIIILHENARETYIKGNLLHYSYDSISDHLRQTNKFTTIAAKAMFEDGKKANCIDYTLRPCLQFIRDYFLKLGFLDGRYGFVICKINALYTFLKYSKLKDLTLNKNID